MTSERRWMLGGLLAAVLFALLFQGARGLVEPTEGRYTAVAVEMLRLHDWLHPALHHQHPHLTKPPLSYWLVAASLRAFGHHTWAARLPGTLAWLLTLLCVQLLGRLLQPDRPWLGAAVYATTVFPALTGNIVFTDGLVALLATAGMTGLMWAVWGPDPRHARRHALLGWIAFGLAFLTKGPPALLPLLAWPLLALVRRRDSSAPNTDLRRLHAPLGLPLMLVVGLSWFAVIIAQRPALIRYFLWDEVVLRVGSDHFHRNGAWYGAFVAFGPVLLLGTLPWTVPMARGLGRGLRDGWQGLRGRITLAPATTRRLLLTLWVAAPLLIFCVAKSRLPWYLTPIFPPLALLAADRLGPRWRQPRAWSVLAAAVWIPLLALRLWGGPLLARKDGREMARRLTALNPGPYREIVFVNCRPYRSLSFYLDVEVEQVTLHGGTGDPALQDVAEELRENEGPRLWIVPRRLNTRFRRITDPAGVDLRLVGETSGMDDYLVYRADQGVK